LQPTLLSFLTCGKYWPCYCSLEHSGFWWISRNSVKCHEI